MHGFRRWCLLVLMCLCLMAVPGGLWAQGKRQPPTPQELEASAKLVRDLYRKQYADSSPAGRLKLANELLKQARATNDDHAAKYTLFAEARELAVLGGGGGLSLAMEIIDATAAEYDIDAEAQKLQAYLAAAPRAGSDEADEIAAIGLRMLDSMIASENSSASKLVTSLQALIARARNDALRSRLKEAQKSLLEMERARLAIEKLKTSADDPD